MVVNFICSLFAFWYVCVIDDLVTLRNCDLVASLDTSIFHYIWTCLSISELRVSLAPLKWFKPSNKYFTDRSKAVLLLWIFYVFFSVLCLLCVCAHLFICALWSPAGKSWRLGFRLCCLAVSFSLSHLIDCCSNIMYYFDMKFKTYFTHILMFRVAKSQ